MLHTAEQQLDPAGKKKKEKKTRNLVGFEEDFVTACLAFVTMLPIHKGGVKLVQFNVSSQRLSYLPSSGGFTRSWKKRLQSS